MNVCFYHQEMEKGKLFALIHACHIYGAWPGHFSFVLKFSDACYSYPYMLACYDENANIPTNR